MNLILKTCETKELKTPEDVRGILKQEYNTNNIRGAILVGQIPFALWEQGYGDNRGILSLFYEDLDGEFQIETTMVSMITMSLVKTRDQRYGSAG